MTMTMAISFSTAIGYLQIVQILFACCPVSPQSLSRKSTHNREDFERTGISTLVTVGVRDIQGEGFPDQFSGLADSPYFWTYRNLD
ncbi:hypothetical protein J1N35_024318 [Gossypium stocksii]|uniref:Copine C-terminal domain-containing protein n=1 Tax=Gossypium stocksii TaxID=47602 RepID=A0A9D3VLN1_9ROSI|nr:hypothetical protein J1N35_024318 [Gossypium stocksii]